MTDIWALTASPDDLASDERARLAAEIDVWLREGQTAVALKTCHRVELYGLGPRPSLGAPRIRERGEAVAHLLRVAAGLESVIVGEDQVLHQVRGALADAQSDRRVDFRLRRLFETAIATGRRARSGRTQASGNLAQSAVAWLGAMSEFSGHMVVVAGAGRMGASLAHSLTRAGATVTVASRDANRAAGLAGIYGGVGVDLLEGARLTKQAVGIAVALGGPWTELAAAEADDLPPVADISAPQAIPDGVRRRLNGSFLGIDDLYRLGGLPPGAYIKDAEALVAAKAAEYMAWLARAS